MSFKDRVVWPDLSRDKPSDEQWLTLAQEFRAHKLAVLNCVTLVQTRYRKEDPCARFAYQVHQRFVEKLGAILDDAVCAAYPMSVTRVGGTLLTELFADKTVAGAVEKVTMIRPLPRKLVGEERAQLERCCADLLAFLEHPLLKRYAPRQSAATVIAVGEWSKS